MTKIGGDFEHYIQRSQILRQWVFHREKQFLFNRKSVEEMEKRSTSISPSKDLNKFNNKGKEELGIFINSNSGGLIGSSGN